MNKKKIHVNAIVIIAALIVFGMAIYTHNQTARKQKAICDQIVTLLEKKKYTEALKELDQLGDKNKASALSEQIETQRSEDYNQAINAIAEQKYETAEKLLKNCVDYQDGQVLYTYVNAITNNSVLYRHTQMAKIPKDYAGLYKEEIVQKRREIEEAYALYEEKKKSSRENKREADNESEEEWEYYLPYSGMLEKYLSSTSVGTAYYYGANTVSLGNGKNKTADIYYYYNGTSIIFVAKVIDGKVYEVSDYRNNPWNRPQVFKSHPYENESVQGGKVSEVKIDRGKKSDPYDAHSYKDADDFADEREDEFDDWDDAWDYWEENH